MNANATIACHFAVATAEIPPLWDSTGIILLYSRPYKISEQKVKNSNMWKLKEHSESILQFVGHTPEQSSI